MELTMNTSSFNYNDYFQKHEKLNINNRLSNKRKNTILNFNKWFEKEHDYCLPVEKKIKTNNIEKNDECLSMESDCAVFDTTKTSTDLEKIVVNNELSGCSLYAIDVTTELLKDALIESKKNQLNYVQKSTDESKYCNNSSNNCESNVKNQPVCVDNNTPLRLNYEDIAQPSYKKKMCCPNDSLNESKLFSLTDIDGDMIKLFPTLDFSTEHSINEKLETIMSNESNTPKILSNGITEEIENTKILSLSPLITDTVYNSPQTIKKKNVKIECETDISQHNLPYNSQKLPAVDSENAKFSHFASEQYISIFNRYQRKQKQFVESVENPGSVLLRDLLCGSKPKTVISPYTHRHLKPYIFRDPVTKPLWLQMLSELKEHVRLKQGLPKCKVVETIDYSYIRAKHVKSVNALAREFFWPGIDLSDSLLYPDFSVVALYKNLVIGFGFMVPDISTNENYITFLFTRPHWTNCGIAKFMIYHLIQTCMTRDITLHVSPNNSAMILYQKFGFKIEEFVENFYENYIPEDSELSKHALFLRLRRTSQRK